MREIYAKLYYGTPFKDSFDVTTANWGPVEKQDFAAWLKYYQGNNHLKYKKAASDVKANFYVSQDIPGYFLPTPSQSASPSVTSDFSEPLSIAQNDLKEKSEKEQKRKIIEDQRKKIIGRLNSAIKHLTSHEGHLLVGSEFEKLLASMYELLKQFQTVNKVSLSNQLYADLIIRQANKLSKNGFEKSASFLKKFADLPIMPGNSTITGVPGKLDFPQGVIPIASQRSDGVAGSLPSNAPSVDGIAVPIPEKLKEKDPLDELLENLETSGITDSNFSEDDEELEEIALDDELTVEAQMMAPNMPSPPPSTTPLPLLSNTTLPANSALPKEEDLEVSLTEEPQQREEAPSKDIDVMIDDALANITIKDVVDKLEDTVSMFRNRQLSRELMMIDLMLHRLGLSSLFGELSEAQQKTLDASNYVLSRLEKILSQLNSAITKPNINLNPPEKILNEESQAIKQQIENKQEREKVNKERRRDMENEQLEQPVVPMATAPPNPSAELASLPPPEIV